MLDHVAVHSSAFTARTATRRPANVGADPSTASASWHRRSDVAPALPTPSIGELAAGAGVRTPAIRCYESVGLLPPAPREVRYRRFSPDTVQLIATLRFARRAGFTVSEIRTLFHGFGAEVPPAERWRVLAERKVEELDALIADAQRMRRALQEGMRCGCLRVEDCVIDGDAGCCLPGPSAARSA